MAKAEIIVVGAGVVGCSIAFHLARGDAHVRVFEKGQVCAGMSARSGALVRMHYTFAPEAELAWKSLAYFQNWRDLVDPSGATTCGFVKTGFAMVVGPENEARLRDNIAMLKRVGVDTVAVSPYELKRLDPQVRVDDIASAAWEPQSGYADPVATTQSLATAARARGAEFELDTPIEAIVTRGGRASAVRTASGALTEADAICVVAGPWTDRFLRPLGVPIGIKAERAQVAFFKRPRELCHLAYIDGIAGSYFRPHGDDLTMIGLGAWKPAAEPDPDAFKEANDTDFVGEVGTRLAIRIPAMRGARYARGHAGIYDLSPDGRAVLGALPGIQGLFVAAGFSGTGFKTSPAVGAAMAELILTGRSRIVDIAPFSYERLRSGGLIESPVEYEMPASFGHKL